MLVFNFLWYFCGGKTKIRFSWEKAENSSRKVEKKGKIVKKAEMVILVKRKKTSR